MKACIVGWVGWEITKETTLKCAEREDHVEDGGDVTDQHIKHAPHDTARQSHGPDPSHQAPNQHAALEPQPALPLQKDFSVFVFDQPAWPDESAFKVLEKSFMCVDSLTLRWHSGDGPDVISMKKRRLNKHRHKKWVGQNKHEEERTKGPTEGT